MEYKQFIFVFLIVAGLSFAAIPSSITIHGKLTNALNVSIPRQTLNMLFAIYNVSTSGTALYTKVVNVTTDYAGFYSQELTNINLSFDGSYFLGVTVANDTEMSPRINFTSNSYAYRANITNYINASGVQNAPWAGIGTCTTNQWVVATTTGAPTCLQPEFINISGTVTDAQMANQKLNISDQRYNDTSIIAAVNTSNNILQLYSAVQRDPQGFPDLTSTLANTHSTLSFNTTTRNFSISPVGANYTYYFKGNLVTQTANRSINITNTTGAHIIYFDVNGVLQDSGVLTDDILCNQVIVAAIVWDAPHGYQYIVQDERHTHFMECETHYYLHEHFGTQYDSGLSPTFTTGGSTSLNSSAQLNTTAGSISDEDFTHDILSYNSSTGGQFRVFYQIGATNNWTIKVADQFPFVWCGGTETYTCGNSRIAYNLNTGGVWSLTQVTQNSNIVLAHFFATNSIDPSRDIAVVLGRAQYTTAALATTGASTEISAILGSGLFSTEFKPLYSVLVQTNSSYTNGAHAIFVNPTTGTFIDWRRATLAGSSGTILAGTVMAVDTSAPLTGGVITSTGTIGITQATTATDGYVSSVNWNTFNNKAGTGNCTAGQAVQNTTTGGVQCITLPTYVNDTWQADKSSYTTTVGIPTLMGNSTIARTGSATCSGVTVAQNVTTTTSGMTSQCITPPQGTVTSVAVDGTMTGGAITTSGTHGVNTSIVALQNQSNNFTANNTFGIAVGKISLGNGGSINWNSTCTWTCFNATICSKVGTGC